MTSADDQEHSQRVERKLVPPAFGPGRLHGGRGCAAVRRRFSRRLRWLGQARPGWLRA